MASVSSLEDIINHVIMPPKLPQMEESSTMKQEAEEELLRLLRTQLNQYYRQGVQDQTLPGEASKSWTSIKVMLSSPCLTPVPCIPTDDIVQGLKAVAESGVITLQLKAQNSAIIFRKDLGGDIVVECFECSAKSDAVMACKGSLIRTFPAHAVILPLDIFTEPLFQSELAALLSKLDSEFIKEMMPQSRKAKSEMAEIRDTADPALATDMLMSILAALGRPVKTMQIQKRIRDDVLWHDCLVPWRRSAFWLTLRVSIQTTLVRSLGLDAGTLEYKNFMAFFMADIAAQASDAKLPGEIYHIINVKIARRLHKLGDAATVQQQVSRVGQKIEGALKLEWEEVQRRDTQRSTAIEIGRFSSDMTLSLHNSKAYLDSVLAYEQSSDSKITSFTPVRQLWMDTSGSLPRLNNSIQGSQEEAFYSLAELQCWVEYHLPLWIDARKMSPHSDDCVALAALANDYYRKATEAYKELPVHVSIMLLTIAELWHAVDVLAIGIIPLLKDYSPFVPINYFQPLLLPTLPQMQRLHRLEEYIAKRYSQSNERNPSIFANPGEKTHFTVRYYADSATHHALRSRIEAEATRKKAEKKKEWEEGSQKYQQLIAKAQLLQHERFTDSYGDMQHDSNCEKCRIDRSARQMSITKYEWPLPRDEPSCTSAIVELDCPESFAAWRNITWMLVRDIGGCDSNDGDSPSDTVFTFGGLKDFYHKKQSRITLASKVKSFTKTHYIEKYPVEWSSCYSLNALQYQTFDNDYKCWAQEVTTEPSLWSMCTMQLPHGPYSNLQYSVDSTCHTQNQVIADQDTCSTILSLHEFVSFGSLRADGQLTQWLNVHRELAATNLNFNTEAVYKLVAQTAWQAGSQSNNAYRLSHTRLRDREFCSELLKTIRISLDSLEANWKSDHAVSALVVIVRRVLSLTEHEIVRIAALDLLKCVRIASHCWTKELSQLLPTSKESNIIRKLQEQLLKAALLCKSTYDVDPKHISEVMSSAKDVKIWVDCCMVVQANSPGGDTNRVSHLRASMKQDLFLTHRLLSRVVSLVLEGNSDGLNDSVCDAWSGFQSAHGSWEALPKPISHWLISHTLDDPNRKSQAVLYNALDGQLLVDGKPLGRLPKPYTQSEVYQRVFGDQILNVFAADMPGMAYMAAQKIKDSKVYFGMRNMKIIIRTEHKSQVLELVPHTSFDGDLPSEFITDFVHWLDLSTHKVELRPLNQLWKSSPDNWYLSYRPQFSSSLVQNTRQLVDIRSKTFAAVMDVFRPMEVEKYTHASVLDSRLLEVHFPRFDICFFLNDEGLFHCRELRQILDPDQSLGTMTGLTSRLVLCAPGSTGRKHDRTLIVPEGEISVQKSGGHVSVSIASARAKGRLFTYSIDPVLGRLTPKDAGSKISVLYKAYLHAVTSHFLPDSLTSRTGCEEALSSLRQRSLRLQRPATEEEVSLLTLIAKLTPGRTPYPEHLMVMQKVIWDPQLSMLAQHDDYISLAEQIRASGDRFSVFYPDFKTNLSLYTKQDKHLLKRAASRNASFRSKNFCRTVGLHESDRIYEGRDRANALERTSKTFEIAFLVRSWPTRLEISPDLIDDLRNLQRIKDLPTTFDTSKPLSELLEISFSASWGPLHTLCRSSSQTHDKYRLLFAFSAMAYGRNIGPLTRLRTLLAFAFSRELQSSVIPPRHSDLPLSEGSSFSAHAVEDVISNYKNKFRPSRQDLRKQERQAENRRFEVNLLAQVETIICHYHHQWICHTPQAANSAAADFFNMRAANEAVSALFQMWTRNGEFENYISQVQPILNALHDEKPENKYEPRVWHLTELLLTTQVSRAEPVLSNLYVERKPPPRMLGPQTMTMDCEAKAPEENVKLRNLVESIATTAREDTKSPIRAQYSKDLLGSLYALRKSHERVFPTSLPFSIQDVDLYRAKCEEYLETLYRNIQFALRPKNKIAEIYKDAGLWPSLTLGSLLVSLSSTSPHILSPKWRTCLLELGIAVSLLQRARRLLLLAEKGEVATFCSEAENIGRVGWSPQIQPDWLLIEIQNDLLIRKNQAEVAVEMICPSTLANSLVQLNMGEGKSSLIVPLVAAYLADGTTLSRVVVLKSLAKQMNDTIGQRLTGLSDREIFFLPFSRKVEVTAGVMLNIQALQKACMDEKGILLAQPEHILSFRLMGIERLTSGDLSIAHKLLQSQNWLETHARDVLDESDEILDVKFQLIYTLGSQRMMDGQPDRWLLTQSMFDLIEKHARILENAYPKQLETACRSAASFPTIRLLSEEIGDRLMASVIEDIEDSHLPALSFEQCPANVKQSVMRFIKETSVSDQDAGIVKDFYTGRESYMEKLLLVRGLVAYKIILFVLRAKRWSVNYGLHSVRCLSAVPYRAKGVPAPSAEFGHPDVAVALTCLSYYYSGLTDSQLRQCLELLQKSDDPTLEYGNWVSRCRELPRQLRDWSAVNPEDERQCNTQLFPALRFSKKVADYYMANVVFPKEGKEFDEKLSTSGWDIPLTEGHHLTTGFSGTNDNRFVLPLSIAQQDLPSLKHTSGKVLDYLLREENLKYICARDIHGRQLPTKGLLRAITEADPNVRILIDVGAQILDLSNKDLVELWIELVPAADAAVFFDEDDTAMVLRRNKKVESLSSSSFQAGMEHCLVYLDEVHTRGIDLKLPAKARAAVTLGPRLSKDRLVQACMRLRKLGHGQSLMFVAPPEVNQQIIQLTDKSANELSGYDVVQWALDQSCLGIERAQPLRVLQGLHHHQRQRKMEKLTSTHPDLDRLPPGANTSEPLISALREKEEQRLTDLYAPLSLKGSMLPTVVESSKGSQNPQIQQLLEMWNNIDFSVTEGASMQEEHEREVAHEVEQETQIERPPKAKAKKPSIDPHLLTYVRTGASTYFEKFLRTSSLITGCSTKPYSDFAQRAFHDVAMSTDFTETIARSQSGHMDNYLRPVNWVLTNKDPVNRRGVVLISQYEVNQLLDEILKPPSGVLLHSYEPRVTKSMRSVDFPRSPGPEGSDASISAWQRVTPRPRQQLHLFAGQLYFNTMQGYRDLLNSIGTPASEECDQVLAFIKKWIAIRRKGQNFLPTHVGQMVSNRTLKEGAFE